MGLPGQKQVREVELLRGHLHEIPSDHQGGLLVLPVSVAGRSAAIAAPWPVAALVGHPVTAEAGPEPSIRADPLSAQRGSAAAGLFSLDVSVWRSGPRPLQAPGIRRSATSRGGRGNPPSGEGGGSAGSPPPRGRHPGSGWRASAPPLASAAFAGRPGPAGWRDPETSTEIAQLTFTR